MKITLARTFALLVLPALATGCGTASEQPPTKAAPVAVSTVRAESTALASSFDAGGIVRARSTAVVSSRIMAPILDVHVRPGDRVRRGDRLITLDSREIDANRARAAAALARTTHERVRGLHEKRSATPQELDQAVSALETADAQLDQAQAHLSAANAARDAAQAASEASTIASSYATLIAPFDGVITVRSVDPGTMASPGAGLLTIEDSTGFRLEVSLDEARATRISTSEPVDVHLGEGGSSDRTIPGRVSEVAQIDPASHSFLVKIDVAADGALRSGLFGRARFTGPSRQTLVVPASAAVRRGQLTFVFTVASDGHARLQAVSPGTAAGDRLEILAGLHEGDLVITDPTPALSDGTPVSGAGR